MPTRNLGDVQHSSVRCVMGEAREFFERPPFGLRRRARLERAWSVIIRVRFPPVCFRRIRK